MSSSSNTPRPSRNRSLPSRFRDGIEDAALSLDFDREPMNENARRRLNDDTINEEVDIMLQRPVRRSRVRNRELDDNDNVRYEPGNADVPRNGNISLQLSTIVENYRNMEDILNWRNEEPNAIQIYEEVSKSGEFVRFYRQQQRYKNYLAARQIEVNNFRESIVFDHYCGKMNDKCIHCGSLFFNLERNCYGKYTICCELGKWNFPHIKKPTALMQELFKGDSERSKLFMKNPRFYNNHLSFASITIDEGQLPY
jgi:hypothetical protein